MRKILPLLVAAFLVPTSFAQLQQPQRQKPLDIYFIDTEGGQATLLVSPSGQSMLVDAWFPDGQIEHLIWLRDYRKAIAPDGMIWVSWPKKASGVVTDLSDVVVREAALALGLVDVKVCAVDEIWSGLKFVIPVEQRGTR